MKTLVYQFFALTLLMLLGGCYESEAPVLERGQQVPLNGHFDCKNAINGDREIAQFSEKKEGWLLPYYTYEANGPHGVFGSGAFTFKQIADDFFLAQIASSNHKPQYLFFDFTSNRSFIVSVADLMTKNAYIEQIAKKHHISSTQGSNVGVLLLKGQPEDILQFLLDHQKYLLSSILSCERTASSVSEAESSPGYHAVVTRDEAVFTFPVDPKDQYEWCPGGLQYAWNVKTGNFQNGFEFGFSLFTSMGAARCDQGKLEDVLQEGQFSVWKLEGNGSSVVPGVIVEHSLSRGGSSLNIIIKGKDTINLLFSQKPAHVVFQSQADAHTSSEKVPVLYSAE